jgi:hypothetical protein
VHARKIHFLEFLNLLRFGDPFEKTVNVLVCLPTENSFVFQNNFLSHWLEDLSLLIDRIQVADCPLSIIKTQVKIFHDPGIKRIASLALFLEMFPVEHEIE